MVNTKVTLCGIEMDNPIICAIPVLNTTRLMDEMNFPAAEEAIHALLSRKKGILGLYRTSMACDGAVCEGYRPRTYGRRARSVRER